MQKAYFVTCLSLIFGLACAGIARAEDKTPAEWQKQALKGVTSLRYGVAEGSLEGTAEEVEAAFSGMKVPAKRIQSLKAESASSLSVAEARVKVVAQERENKQCWVGLSVDQRCQLKRIPSINLDSETYSVGKMCPQAQAIAAVKDVCRQFISDFTAQTK